MALFSVRKILSLLALALLASAGFALAADGVFPPLVNWAAPATFSFHSASRGASTMADITNPTPFIGITPCRQYDSRNTTALPTATNRTVTIEGAPCGIPSSAGAVSLNITVFNITGATGNGVFLVGTSGTPTSAWINYPPTETQRGNAGALPLSVAGAIVVRVEQGGGSVDFTVDVNGYYYNAGDSSLFLTAGELFAIYGTRPGGTVVYAENNSITSGSRAFRGVASGASGSTYGVLGQTSSTATNSSGLRGEATAATGVVAGAEGKSFSVTDGSTGVAGFDSASSALLTPGFTFTTGVRGNGNHGVAGVTSNPLGWGVVGVRTSTSGSVQAEGQLGYMPAATAFGVFAYVGDVGCSACAKSFIDPHPTDPTKTIHYVSLEGNEAGTYFRGTAQTVGGTYIINVPEDFRLVTDPEGLTVQLTPVGAAATMYVVYEDLNQIIVNSSTDVKFHYLVQGIRPAFKDFKPIHDDGVMFVPQTGNSKMPEGWSAYTKKRLIANGTYKEDGTVNMQTAERVGWAKMWREQEEVSRAIAAAKAAERAATSDPEVRQKN